MLQPTSVFLYNPPRKKSPGEDVFRYVMADSDVYGGYGGGAVPTLAVVLPVVVPVAVAVPPADRGTRPEE
jgi:hypothetical protein